jgi:uncharacterized protein DUF2442
VNPYVKSVKPQENYCLLLTFENGEKREFDLKPYFEKPVFRSLKNMAVFKTARVVSGSVEWQGEVDLSYDTLYIKSKAAKETPSPHKTSREQKKKLAMASLPKKRTSKTRSIVK